MSFFGSGIIQIFKHYLLGIWLAIRILLFERLSRVASFAWWGVWLVMVVTFWGTLGVILFGGLALGLYRPFITKVLSQQYRLIRSGDTIEYVLGEEDPVPQFQRGRVLRLMDREHVERFEHAPVEAVDVYGHFFVVEGEDKPYIIPFEWVVTIEGDGLDL